MRRSPVLASAWCFLFAAPCPTLLAADGPASSAADPAPKGDVTKYSFSASKIFPGTVRDYWIYVPKQYDPARPACAHVNQDGVQFKAPEVFDQLIHKREMPVTIGVFVTPGRVPAPRPDALDRFNRSFEYDGLGDEYVRFLLEELLPDVETKTAPDGRAIRLSKSGNDRSIGGSSSGAICAFTAAWERPDAFGRVFSAIGTYVGLRGGNEYPTLIRKTEPKPLRVFLEDGSGDQNIYGGDWWMANQEMERALVFAGYEVNHAWGDGGHNGKHATEIFADAMRWLWKDWPAPIKAGAGSPQLQDIVVAGEGWKRVEGTYQSAWALAANSKGEVFFRDLKQKVNFKISADGLVVDDSANPLGFHAQAYGPGDVVVASVHHSLVTRAADGKEKTVADDVNADHLAVLRGGGIYTANFELQAPPGMNGLCYCPPLGMPTQMDSMNSICPAGVACSPDQSLLYLADGGSHWVYSYQIQPDGSLKHKQRYYRLHSPDSADHAGASALRVDRDGRLYVATAMGVQVCDQAGRVNCILPTPGPATGLEFAGAEFDTLYVVCGDRLYQRKMKVHGIHGFDPPHKPEKPKL